MAEQWLLEIIGGIGRFFMHPLLYVVIGVSFILGVMRVKRERRDFHTRVFDAISESKDLLYGIGFGLLLSVVFVGLGLSLPQGMIAFVGALALLLVLTLQVQWLSAAHVLGLAIIAALFVPEMGTGYPLLNRWISQVATAPLAPVGLLLGGLLLVEGLLIVKNAVKGTSPQLMKSKRGKMIGLHQAKKLWLVPVFLLVPGGELGSPLSWWPVLDIGGTSFSIWLVPFALGFRQRVQGSLPVESIRITGKRIIALSVLVIAVAVGGLWLPLLTVVAAVIAFIGREALAIRQRFNDDQNTTYFSRRDHGLVILGVLPGSPAEKMGLLVGEVVTKVNGKEVHTEKGFYEALQSNLAFCKLEVLDYNGEVRFAQRALYDGEHYELGLLFVHDENDWDMQAI